jgi:hypothetical protein
LHAHFSEMQDPAAWSGSLMAVIESEVYGSTDQSRCVLDTLQLDPA